jgi:hypothetical protein
MRQAAKLQVERCVYTAAAPAAKAPIQNQKI